MHCGLNGYPRNNNVSELTLKRGPDIGFTMAARYGDTGLTIPVPYFRPITENTAIGVDIGPTGPNPPNFASNGMAWLDINDADVRDSNYTNGSLIPLHCLRMGNLGTAVQVGPINFNGATDIPLQFVVGTTTGTGIKGSINGTGVLKMGQGTDTPIFGSLVSVNDGTASSINVRNSTDHVEWFAISSTTGAYMGSATNHQLVLRTNNADRLTLDTSGNVAVAAGTVSAQNLYTSGGPLKVLQTVDTTNRTATSATFVASGTISPSLTPTSSSNKIMIQVSGLVGASVSNGIFFTLYRSIGGGAYAAITPGGSAEMQGFVMSGNTVSESLSFSFLDSPATTSAVLYQIYFRASAGDVFLGRRGVDTFFNSPTIITVTEIKG